MKIKINGALNDTKDPINSELPNDFIPRKDDIIYFKNKRYIVDSITIDYDYSEIGIWVKDSK